MPAFRKNQSDFVFHLDHVGHPIVGDKIYERNQPGRGGAAGGGAAAPPLINRQRSTATELRLPTPLTGRLLHLVAPYPDDFARLIETLVLHGNDA